MMQFRLLSLGALTLFCSSFITPSLASPNDVLYIQKLSADYAINVDTKNYKDFDVEFTANATFDAGNGVFSKGLPAIKARVASLLGNNVTQNSLTTSSITLLPPFDNAVGGASRASAIQYVIAAFIGQPPANAGKAYILYGLFKDQLVRTDAIGDYGGWRFTERAFKLLVRFFFLVPPPPPWRQIHIPYTETRRKAYYRSLLMYHFIFQGTSGDVSVAPGLLRALSWERASKQSSKRACPSIHSTLAISAFLSSGRNTCGCEEGYGDVYIKVSWLVSWMVIKYLGW